MTMTQSPPTGSALADDLPRPDDLRQQAIKRLKKRRDFYGHLLCYLLINGFLVVIWAVTGTHHFFWPVYPIVGWGVIVVLNAWDVFRSDIGEDQIRAEMRRLQDRR